MIILRPNTFKARLDCFLLNKRPFQSSFIVPLPMILRKSLVIHLCNRKLGSTTLLQSLNKVFELHKNNKDSISHQSPSFSTWFVTRNPQIPCVWTTVLLLQTSFTFPAVACVLRILHSQPVDRSIWSNSGTSVVVARVYISSAFVWH